MMKIGLFGSILGSLSCMQATGIPGSGSGRYIIARPETQHGGDGAWPHAPFNTKGRDIVNGKGEIISWAGVNWPMSGTFVLIVDVISSILIIL
jgi:hypothetical protein